MGESISSREYIAASREALLALEERAEVVDRIAAHVAAVLGSGHKVMTCGNGGSAAEALHLSEEMIGRYRRDRPALAALSLNADPTALTCIANDWAFAEVFARQVSGLGRRGDALVALSTSGRSPSILRALEQARELGVSTIGLLGPKGSPAEGLCDVALTFEPGLAASHIQEIHIVVIHAVLEHLETVEDQGKPG